MLWHRVTADTAHQPDPQNMRGGGFFMSEPIPTEISIGGKVREDQVTGLCQAIAKECVSLEWGDACFTPETAEELLAACQEHDGVRVLWLCDDQANYGSLETLQEFLKREQIPFRHKSDAKYEFDAEVIEYRPEIGEVRFSSDTSGQPLIQLKTMTSIAEAVDKATNSADGQTTLELLRRLRNIQQLIHENMPTIVLPLAAFEIVGQGARKET
jgi:hypothetical protein